MKVLHVIVFILVVVGGLNWGLVGIGGFTGMNLNLVNLVLGNWPVVEWIVYVLVGLATIVLVVTHKKDCRACSVSSAPAMPGSM